MWWTHGTDEYDRSGGMSDRDIDAAIAEWCCEEREERLRQLRDRWSVLELGLPPGQACAERLQHQAKEEAELSIEAELAARLGRHGGAATADAEIRGLRARLAAAEAQVAQLQSAASATASPAAPGVDSPSSSALAWDMGHLGHVSFDAAQRPASTPALGAARASPASVPHPGIDAEVTAAVRRMREVALLADERERGLRVSETAANALVERELQGAAPKPKRGWSFRRRNRSALAPINGNGGAKAAPAKSRRELLHGAVQALYAEVQQAGGH